MNLSSRPSCPLYLYSLQTYKYLSRKQGCKDESFLELFFLFYVFCLRFSPAKFCYSPSITFCLYFYMTSSTSMTFTTTITDPLKFGVATRQYSTSVPGVELDRGYYTYTYSQISCIFLFLHLYEEK